MSDSGPPHPDKPILPADWRELDPLIDRVLDAAPERRAALIVELSGGDPDRERALAHLVAECERGLPLLDRPAAERFSELTVESHHSILPALVADRYQVGRELGRGGMACVYLARDVKHGRDVAIKVIRPELAVTLGHERFLREIEIAARLRHPNIVPLYDSGEVGGSLYFVMPYEEGESLRARLDRVGRLSVDDALGVLRDVARALAYAHEHGVVHRDVKPDNVMLSGGAAVVTDFGIAKAVSAALGDVAGTTLTQTGSGIGTPAYMAPEQATGDPATDHRADIYSFGCLGYELFTGKPPFHGLSKHEIIAGHITTVPRPVEELRPELPPSMAALIARCLEKDPDRRPQSSRDALKVIDGAASTGGVTPPPERIAPPPKAHRVWQAGLMLGAALLAAAGLYLSRSSRAPAPVTLTVLPFGNTNADSTLNYVADGLAEEVATALARVPGIQVTSRSAARAYRGQLGVDVSEAGARLRAEYVLTAIVRQDRENWILSADLARAADAASIWADNFHLRPDQQAGAAEQIATSLVAAMRARFPRTIGAVPVVASTQHTTNGEAYRLYLRGQEKLNRRAQSVREAADLFRRSIQLDARFASAYSGLSLALALHPYFQGVPAKEIREELLSVARRALELDPTLAQPHIALGLAARFDHRWDAATVELETAIRLDGHSVEARVQYARHLLQLGRTADARTQLRAAETEDPTSALVLGYIAYTYYLEGRLDSALVESTRALDNDPANLTTILFGAMIRLGAGRPGEARGLISQMGASIPFRAYLIAKSGDTAAARQRLRAEDAETPQPWMAETRRAFGNLGLGDTARALSALERATDAGEIWPALNPVIDPVFDPVRRSVRFQALLRRLGLTDSRASAVP